MKIYDADDRWSMIDDRILLQMQKVRAYTSNYKNNWVYATTIIDHPINLSTYQLINLSTYQPINLKQAFSQAQDDFLPDMRSSL
jgi:hypothetical protein